MSESLDVAAPVSLLAEAHSLVDELLERPLAFDSDDTVLEAMRSLHRLTNRLAAVEHKLIRETDVRNLAWERGARDTAALLRSMLLLDPNDARARVRAADAAGPQRTLTGEPLAAAYAEVAAGQAAGDVSPRQAAVIVGAVTALPHAVQAAHGVTVETELVGFAATLDPVLLAKAALRIAHHLDPDSVLTTHEDRERARDLTPQVRPDGSGTLRGELTPECMQRLLVHLDALSAPRPAADGTPDPRSAGQRRHDALLAMLDLQQRAELLPSTGGVAATLVLTATAQDWAAGTGLATTAHGADIPVPAAQRWVGADIRVIATVLDRLKAVAGYSSSHRILTEQQRLAIHARDRGCIFPGCDAPSAWCQIHHVTAWADGGTTSVGNGVLLCKHHHRTFSARGWHLHMRHGTPEWTPPRWIDPHRRPRRNHVHDTLP